MAKTFTAPFAQTPKTVTANCNTACNISSTPSNTTLLLTAGGDGCVVTRISALPSATVTATTIVLFLSKNGGVTKNLIDANVMTAQTVSATTGIVPTNFNYTETSPLRLEASDSIYVGAQVALASGIIFKAEYTDF